MLNFIAIDLQLYKIFKITQVLIFWLTVYVCVDWLFLLCYACISVAYAIMQCLSACPSVCSSICPSRTCILSKRINISSKFFHHWVATPFWFSTLSVMAIFDRNPPNGGHQMGRLVGKNCDFRPVSGFIACCQWFDH